MAKYMETPVEIVSPPGTATNEKVAKIVELKARPANCRDRIDSAFSDDK